MYTPVFERFIAPATRYPAIWRIVVGLVTAAVVYVALALAIFFAGGLAIGLEGPEDILRMLSEPASPAVMAILLASFFGMALAACAAALWHWRSPLTLFGPLRMVWSDWKKAVLLAAGTLLLCGLVTSYFIPSNLSQSHGFAAWAGLMIWAVPLLFVQTTAEEMVFRGYLQQQLAARFRHPFVWMGLPSILFGLAHYNPGFDTLTGLLVVLATGTFGLVAADLTRLTGNLGAAMGFHFANNFLALLVVSVQGELSALALFQTDFTMSDSHIIQPLLLADICVVIVVWLVIRRMLRR
ncbi:MAG: CPBP family intramembrane metalloprotease [Paracoccaceae bacterium]